MNTTKYNGYYKFAALPPADTAHLSEFTTGEWAGMSQLFTQDTDGRHIYPYFADWASGYLPNWGEGDGRHPLLKLEAALSQGLHNTQQPLRLLSYQVGQVADEERTTNKIHSWEREFISAIYSTLEDSTLAQPDASWKRSDFKKYYPQIRKIESKKLHNEVVELAGLVAIQNTEEQLYVAKRYAPHMGAGWLAPLIGLSINPEEKSYREQVHDVVAVIQQNDGTRALLDATAANFYTAYVPFKGLKKT